MGVSTEEIRMLAHSLWVTAGCPEKNCDRFWYEAERILKEEAMRGLEKTDG
jgi:DUF2934 family protein